MLTMAHVKTAISLHQSLYKQVEELAKQMNIPRSQLFAMAIKEFIRQHRNRQLLEQINRVYAGEPDSAEREYLKQMKHKHRRRVEAEGRW